MQAPRHWQTPRERPGALAHLLTPAGRLYAAATRRRLARGARVHPGVPVICVGGLTAGGSGKTPTTIALIERLSARGAKPHVVSRGHGGRAAGRGTRRVGPRDDAAMVGDEPVLMAAFAPVWVGDRTASARAAVAAGASHILLDDGFQDPALAHDLGLVVADAALGFGNGRPIPAGPLREDLAAGLVRADALLTIGNAAAQSAFDAAWGPAVALPRLRGHLAPLATGWDLTGRRVFAFAGIAYPRKFFDTLAGLGADIAGTRALDDHQPLSPALLARLAAEAERQDAQLVTTEKDAVRLPPDWHARVLTIPVRLSLDDPGPLEAALDALA